MKNGHKVLITLILLFFGIVAFSAPKKELWPIWLENDPHSKAHIDHHLWQRFLDRYLVIDKSGNNLVRYAEVLSKDYDSLESYIKEMSSIRIDEYNRNEQLAYWINVYNALTTLVVLRHYPVKSIKDVDLNTGWFDSGPWNAKLFFVNNQPITLNDIQHRILRPIWQDARIHYVLNYASMGSPNLQSAAFRADNVNLLLEKSALDFINSPKAVMVRNNKLIASKIYEWYKDDFGGTDQNIIDHIKHYARSSLRQELESFHRINSTQYDWLLNDAS